MAGKGNVPVWPAKERFLTELKDLKKATKDNVSSLTELALEEPKTHYKNVVGAICHQMRGTRPAHRVALVVVLDAICRKSKRKFGKSDVFVARFVLELPKCFSHLEELPSADVDKAEKIVTTWVTSQLFPPYFIDNFRNIIEKAKAAGNTTKYRSKNSSKPSDQSDPVEPSAREGEEPAQPEGVDDFGDDVYVSAPLYGAEAARASALDPGHSPEVSDVSNALSWGERKGYTGREGDVEV
eukprot:CAMPEP_0198227894 /NCGR_PEP_ID=MMETSP1445-20131203/111066_1 /TAXON_ID=36898 /ORGANISM="Pyramimonas sp., Strain CCMP2087" /LENGTH=239 /DNA_ID=CAMNT_0043908091 /DNA_START=174 /DNA_END=890 /DNA_ORIENTATION=-